MAWATQDSNDSAKVQVSGDYNRSGGERTDFLVVDKSTGQHAHYSIGSEPGSQLNEHHGYDRG
jgi:hypothetical protein